MADEGDPLEGELRGVEAWAAEARAKEAAGSRIRERWLRTQADEGARFATVLAGLVEQQATVTVTTLAGRPVMGRLTGVGEDFVAVRLANGQRTLVALHAVAWLRDVPRRRALATDDTHDRFDGFGDGSGRATLVDVLAQAVADRPRVTVHAGGGAITGELRAVGVDVLALDTAGDPPGLAYVRTASVYEISFLDSG